MEQHGCLLLLPVPDGSYRWTAERDWKGRWYVPRAPWFTKLLQHHGFQDRAHDVPVIVKVTAGHTYAGPITQWGPEEWLLWVYHMQRVDSYSLTIAERFVFGNISFELQRDLRQHRKKHCYWSKQGISYDGQVGFLFSSRMATQGVLMDGSHVKERFSIDAWESVSVHLLPAPVVFLISKNAFHTLLMRWHWGCHVLTDFPPAGWTPDSGQVNLQDRTDKMLSPQAAHSIAGFLRKFAPVILATADEDVESFQLQLELEHAIGALDGHSGLIPYPVLPSRCTAYQVEAIVRTLIIASQLQNRAKVASLLQSSLAVLFPGHSTEDLKKLTNIQSVPSGGSLTRNQVM